jgi:ABC-type glycerol-3-phosphate transport system permease component
MTRVEPRQAQRALQVVAVHGVLIVGALASVFPLYWVVKSSFTPLADIFSFPPELVPSRFTFDNYRALFDAAPFLRNLLNSLVVALVYTVVVVALSAMVGFGFAKYRQAPGARILFLIMLASIMVPFETLAISLFVTIARLEWVNTYQGLIIPLVANGFAAFMMTQFMESMPGEILDAARIDGCNDLRAFWTVVVPIMRPALGALATLQFVHSWNNFFWPLLVLNREEMYTVPVVLGSFVVQQAVVPYHVIVTGITVATVPMVVFFLLGQRQFIAGLTMGAFK